MRKSFFKSFAIVTLGVSAFLLSCNKEDVAPEIASEQIQKVSIPTSGFSLWTTCGSNAYVSGSNIIVPIGTGCSSKVNAAQAKNSIYGSNWSCNGSIAGGSGAYSGASEMAIFTCDNVSSWNGNEMGFVRTLDNGHLKAYLQGGGAYIYTLVAAGSTWKCSATGASKVDFYTNNTYRTSLTNNVGRYQNRNWYFVATNHYYGGGNPANWKITFNSANVW